MLNLRHRSQGFSLVELIIAIAVFGIMLALAVPSMGTWLRNASIRTNTEAIVNGAQLARTEAIRRNTNVKLVLDSAGTSWTINLVSDNSLIQQRDAEARAEGVAVSFCPTAQRTMTFSPLGTVTDAGPISQIRVNAVASTSATRRMCITVSTGGVAKMCDPQRLATDPQGCAVVPEICQEPAAACP